MDLSVLALVLLAAFTHAAWNGWLKKSSPDLVGLGAIATGWLIFGVAGLLYVGPPDSSLHACDRRPADCHYSSSMRPIIIAASNIMPRMMVGP